MKTYWSFGTRSRHAESGLNTVTAARNIGGEIHMLVAGSDCAGAATASAKIPGIAKVLQVDADHYAHHLAEDLAVLIAGLANKNYSRMLAPATPSAEPDAARVGFRSTLPNCRHRRRGNADTFVRPIYAGSLLAYGTVQRPDQSDDGAAVPPSAAAASEGGTASIENDCRRRCLWA